MRNLLIVFMFFLTIYQKNTHSVLFLEGLDFDKMIELTKDYPDVCFIKSDSLTATGTLCESNNGYKYILTAAHVCKDIDRGYVFFFEAGKSYKIKKCEIPELYNKNSKSCVEFDVGIIFLEDYPENIQARKITSLDAKELLNLSQDEVLEFLGFGVFSLYDQSGRGSYLKNGSHSGFKAIGRLKAVSESSIGYKDLNGKYDFNNDKYINFKKLFINMELPILEASFAPG
ncbi:MAG: hypothetical protein Q8K37_00875, partial [Alphaproteobacteria bacterium]|nr:hypothetical protein [Alphaproteobacteria bacterium]